MGLSSSRKRKRERKLRRNRERKRRKKLNRDRLRNIDLFLWTTFDSVIPDDNQKRICEELIQKVYNTITSNIKKAEVILYGSQACGLALRRSDVDICVKKKAASDVSTMRRILNHLESIGFLPDDMISGFPIPVPGGGTETVQISTCQDLESKIWVDISVNNSMAPLQSAFVKAVVDCHFINKVFLTLIKHFAARQRLNGKGRLPNSGHVLLGVYVLQKNKKIPRFLTEEQTSDYNELLKESDSYKIPEDFSGSRATLASLFVDYFQYYSEFDFTRMAISIRGGCLVTKESLGWPDDEDGYHLAIVDPFTGQNAGVRVGTEGLKKIKLAFETARNVLADGSELGRLFQRRKL